MTDPRKISISDFSYQLPAERIAVYPLAQRDASKLLIYNKGEISEDIYRNLSLHIPSGSCLYFNDTKVVEARILFQKSSGGVIEIFCLEPSSDYRDITEAMSSREKVNWLCLIGGASKWKPGQILQKQITLSDNQLITLTARYLEKRPDNFLVELSWSPASLSFAEILHYAGSIPLPPYIKRAAEESDIERYQTVYAMQDGSVAAPTAGLHFTNEILQELKEKKTGAEQLTLHVGAGTFKPVKSSTMEEHTMHAEWIDVKKTTIENILLNLNKPIIAVGTTSLRTLESLYWLGLRIADCELPGELDQWYAYDIKKIISVEDALKSLLAWMGKNKMDRLVTRTQLLIVPGYEFKIVDALITNFHQPQSTLLLLVAAFIGEDWRKVYDYALKNEFRFLSYGDGCLLYPPAP